MARGRLPKKPGLAREIQHEQSLARRDSHVLADGGRVRRVSSGMGKVQMEQLQPMREDVEVLFDLDWDDDSDTAVWTPPPEVLSVIERAKAEPGPLLA